MAIEDGVREFPKGWRGVLLNLKTGRLNSPALSDRDEAIEEIISSMQQWGRWCHETSNVLNTHSRGVQHEAKKGVARNLDGGNANCRRANHRGIPRDLKAAISKGDGVLAEGTQKSVDVLQISGSALTLLCSVNLIESNFGTIRHRTARTRRCLTCGGLLNMMFKPGRCAQKTSRRLRKFKELGKVIEGIHFTDGIGKTMIHLVAV